MAKKNKPLKVTPAQAQKLAEAERLAEARTLAANQKLVETHGGGWHFGGLAGELASRGVEVPREEPQEERPIPAPKASERVVPETEG